MTWASEEDLLHGDMALGDIDTQFYLDRAQEEIEIHLAQHYDLTSIPAVAALPAWQVNALKHTQARIATGRMLMAQCAQEQNEDLHSYGLWLLGLGLEDLAKFGTTWLIDGATAPAVTGASLTDMTPSIIQPNKRSPFERFEKVFYDDDDGPSFEQAIPNEYQWVKLGG